MDPDPSRAIAISSNEPIFSSTGFPELSHPQIINLFRDIESSGYAVLPGFLSQSTLESLRTFVDSAVSSADGGYVALNGKTAVAGTELVTIAESASLRRMCARLCEAAGHNNTTSYDNQYHQVLRCLTGKSGRTHSMIFHYDSYLLTMLAPIQVPCGKEMGELLMLPNVRSIRRWYALNLIDKVIVDNPLSQIILRVLFKWRPRLFVRIRLNPGDLYLFWGYRSIHTNAPSDDDKIRATALFHIFDPHRGSGLKKRLRK
jgi:hypothetical protein